MIYLILALYLLVIALRYDLLNRKNGRKFHFWLAYTLMVSLMIFRYRVGGDTLNYISMFENSTPSVFALELLANGRYQLIPSIIFAGCKVLFDDFISVQAIFALFVNTVVFLFLKRNTQYYFTAILLYGLTFYMRLNCEIMRESLAVCFFLLGYPSLMKQKMIKYYVFAVLAYLCHSSAIIVFILPFLLRDSYKKNVLLMFSIILFGAVLFVYRLQVMDSLSNYMDIYSDYNSTIWGKLYIVLFNIIIPSLFLYQTRGYLSRYVRIGVMFYLICSVASLFVYIAFRFNNYLMVFYILMVSDFFVYQWKNKTISQSKIGVILLTSVFLYSFMSSYFDDVTKTVGHEARWYCVWYPYYSVFNPETDDDRETFIANQRLGY